MSYGSLESNRLCIHRFQVDCLVPSDHPSPERVRRHIVQVAEQHLAPTIRMILERGLAPSDPRLCFIKRLDMKVDVNMGWDPGQLAQCLATSAIRHLYTEIDEAGHSANVVRFQNPAEYLASFLSDVVQGCAWAKWYYGPFDGLRVLPLSAAIRTALSNHAEHGLAALHKLDNHRLRQVLTSLTHGDCERTIESLVSADGAGDQNDAYDTVVSVLKQLPYIEARRLSPEAGALWLLVEITRRHAKCSHRAVADAAFIVCRCVQYVDSASGHDRTHMIHVLRTGGLTNIDASLFAHAMEWLVPLLSRSESWRHDFVDLLIHEGRSSASPQGGQDEAVRITPFGGIFYLLPLFHEIPLEGLLDKDCRIDGVSIEALLRWLVLVKAYGGQEAVSVARDPLVQELCGIPPGVVSRLFLSDCQRMLDVSDLERMARYVIQQDREMETTAETVWGVTTVVTEEGAVTVLFDVERGVWLWAVRAGPHALDLILRKVQQTLAHWPAAARLILCDSTFYSGLTSMNTFERVLDLSVPVQEGSEEGQLLARRMRVVGSLAEELDYFRLPPVFGFSRARDRALSVLTHAYLRRFASQLPGFFWSTGPYLAQNLLACQATVEQESERQVVRISCPPLHFVLNTTGLNRRQFTLPWVGSRPFVLFPEDT